MMNAVTEYINANCPPSETEPDPESAATPTTAVPNVPRTLKSESMSYVFDHSHMLTDTQRAELEAQAKEISLRHHCGVYVAFVDDYIRVQRRRQVFTKPRISSTTEINWVWAMTGTALSFC